MVKPIIFGSGEEMLRREGLNETPAAWEDGVREKTEAGFFEWWYFDAHFEDGSTAVVVFFTKSLLDRSGPLKPAVTITLTQPDGRKYSAFSLASANHFSAAQKQCDVRIGENYVRGDLRRYQLNASADDISVDWVLNALVPAWRPGTGKNYYESDYSRYFGWLAAVPFGTIEGTITLNGISRSVKGTCYHDHNWGNVSLESVLSHWYWGRAHVAEYTTIFVEMNSTPQYGSQKIPVFLLARGARTLIDDGQPLTLQISDLAAHPSGKQIPRQALFLWKNPNGQVSLQLSDFQTIETVDLLTTLPPWKSWLARMFHVRPYYFRFNTKLELQIDLPGLKTREVGSSLFEIMLLR